jgi:hypothetical protein
MALVFVAWGKISVILHLVVSIGHSLTGRKDRNPFTVSKQSLQMLLFLPHSTRATIEMIDLAKLLVSHCVQLS